MDITTSPAGDSQDQAPSAAAPVRRRRRTTRAIAGLGVAAVIFGGGAAIGGSLASAAPATVTTQLTSAQVKTTSATSARRATRPPSPLAQIHRCLTRAAYLRRHHRVRASRAVFRRCVGEIMHTFPGMYGEATFKTKTGSATLGWERGKVTTAPGSGTSFVVQAANGTQETWNLTSKSLIILGSHRTTGSHIADNQHVFVFGPASNSGDTARLVLVRP